jgi:beta-xylosidase
MVWTCGRRKIGYSSSSDLVNWSPQRSIPVDAGNDSVQNTWAPELFFDKSGNEWVVFWSSTIDGMFADTRGQVENNRNHRIYYMKTKDFITFSDPDLFFDPGYPVIDATIMPVSDSVIMIFKDERRWPLGKQMMSATARSVYGPWHIPGDTLTLSWTEGPSLISIGEGYILYFDKYRKPQHMGALFSPDLKEWKDITGQLSVPPHFKHGSFLPVSGDEKRRIISEQP